VSRPPKSSQVHIVGAGWFKKRKGRKGGERGEDMPACPSTQADPVPATDHETEGEGKGGREIHKFA